MILSDPKTSSDDRPASASATPGTRRAIVDERIGDRRVENQDRRRRTRIVYVVFSSRVRIEYDVRIMLTPNAPAAIAATASVVRSGVPAMSRKTFRQRGAITPRTRRRS